MEVCIHAESRGTGAILGYLHTCSILYLLSKRDPFIKHELWLSLFSISISVGYAHGLLVDETCLCNNLQKDSQLLLVLKWKLLKLYMGIESVVCSVPDGVSVCLFICLFNSLPICLPTRPSIQIKSSIHLVNSYSLYSHSFSFHLIMLSEHSLTYQPVRFYMYYLYYMLMLCKYYNSFLVIRSLNNIMPYSMITRECWYICCAWCIHTHSYHWIQCCFKPPISLLL